MTSDSPADPNRVAPTQPPLNFVDGNGYTVLRGVAEAKDCEVGWNKVMKACGSGNKKAVGKNFKLLLNADLSEEQAWDPELPPRPRDVPTVRGGVPKDVWRRRCGGVGAHSQHWPR